MKGFHSKSQSKIEEEEGFCVRLWDVAVPFAEFLMRGVLLLATVVVAHLLLCGQVSGSSHKSSSVSSGVGFVAGATDLGQGGDQVSVDDDANADGDSINLSDLEKFDFDEDSATPAHESEHGDAMPVQAAGRFKATEEVLR